MGVWFVACGCRLGVPFINEPTQVLHCLIIGGFAFIGGGLCGFTEHPGIRITRSPTCDFHRALPVKVNVAVGSIHVVKGNVARLYEILPNVLRLEVEVHTGLQLAGMGDATREFALTPVREEIRVDGEQVPPRAKGALRIGFQVATASDEVEVGQIEPCPLSRRIFTNP